jgi:methionyl-tRNA formyltransferase
MGSAEIACVSLQALLESDDMDVVGMVTQPERPSGRGKHPASCPAYTYAQARGVELYAPDRVNTPEAVARIRAWQPDIGVVVAYGQILRRELLAVPSLGFVNVHTSLLPKYRGAAPIQRAVANGDRETGVTIMQMDEGMDTGDMLAQQVVPIGEHDTAGMVHDRLAVVGAGLLLPVLRDIQAGRVRRLPQNPAHATHAAKLQKAEGKLDWTQPARYLYNRVRGFSPWPGCYCYHDCGSGQRLLRVLEARVEPGRLAAPGEVIGVDGEPVIACGEGALRLVRVQPEGGKAMAAAAFLCGRAMQVGERLGG